MTIVDAQTSVNTEQSQSSLSTAAARNLASTTKSIPQMQEITSRWLLRVLPWVQVTAGTYRVNRRLSYAIGDGRLSFTNVGDQIRVVPPELCELPQLRGFDDMEALEALAQRFTQREFAAGETIVELGRPADHLYLLAHGKVDKVGEGWYGSQAVLEVLADGQFFGERTLVEQDIAWDYGVRAATRCTVLALPRAAFQQMLDASDSLRAHIQQLRSSHIPRQNKHGEAEIEMSAGHQGEPQLPATSIIAMRTGEDHQGVVGLHQIGIPDEYQPSLSVRLMGINDQAIISYLVSAYYSVAILVPDALGVLENVEIGHFRD